MAKNTIRPNLDKVVKDVQRLTKNLTVFTKEPIRVIWYDNFGQQHTGYTQPSMGLQG